MHASKWLEDVSEDCIKYSKGQVKNFEMYMEQESLIRFDKKMTLVLSSAVPLKYLQWDQFLFCLREKTQAVSWLLWTHREKTNPMVALSHKHSVNSIPKNV